MLMDNRFDHDLISIEDSGNISVSTKSYDFINILNDNPIFIVDTCKRASKKYEINYPSIITCWMENVLGLQLSGVVFRKHRSTNKIAFNEGKKLFQ